MFFEKSSTQSNLDRFLFCTTPVVHLESLSKSEARNLNQLWHQWERETVDYFTLTDLWSTYAEWSAYGAGVPISLKNEETLVQYYVPYLSAIQIFTSNLFLRGLREETDSGDGDSFSDESEGDKVYRWDASSEEGGSEQDFFLHQNNRLGHLYFQCFERSTPYARVPLVDKVNTLSERYPGLMSLRSVDLSPASWMAVAWYPIYHIPMGRTVKDLSTCFLTYHTLSSSFQDMDIDDEMERLVRKRQDREGISLPPFGLATYKLQGEIWGSGNDGPDEERIASLQSVADSWLKQLRVQHHDFDYFTGIRRS